MNKFNKKDTVTRLTIAHLNDTHSHFEASSLPITIDNDEQEYFVSVGGFSRIATQVAHWRQYAKQEQRSFLFLHAGDSFQGSLYFSLYKGQANVEMLNALGLDAMTIGNHELDMGNAAFSSFCAQMEFPLLAGNWDLSQEDESKAFLFSQQPHVYSYQPQRRIAQWLVKKTNADDVAIFGVSIDKMAEISAPDEDTPFVDALQVITHTVQAILQTGINKIILVSHLGYEQDKQVAEQVVGLSLIIGGHSHVLQGDYTRIGLDHTDNYGVAINGTYVVQAGSNAIALGHCNIDFLSDGSVLRFEGENELLLGRQIFANAQLSSVIPKHILEHCTNRLATMEGVRQCAKKHQIETLLNQKFKPQVEELANQPLIILSRNLKHQRLPTDLTNLATGSVLTSLVARSFYFMMNSQGHDVEFAVHNAGGVRASLYSGIVTKADIAGKVLPFPVAVGTYTLLGKDLWAMLNGALRNALDVDGTGSGSFPYCYNLKYRIQQEQGICSIADLKIYRQGKWEDVEQHRLYKGASSAYTMTGREGYDSILNRVGTSYISRFSMADCFIYLLQSVTDKELLPSVDHYD